MWTQNFQDCGELKSVDIFQLVGFTELSPKRRFSFFTTVLAESRWESLTHKGQVEKGLVKAERRREFRI